MSIVYKISWRAGYLRRTIYSLLLPWIVKHNIAQTKKIEADIYYFSSGNDLPEQMASIRSFIYYVGIPDKIIVVSDGTYTQGNQQLLCKIHSSIKVIEWNTLVRDDLPQSIYAFAKSNFLGKKLAVLMSLPINRTTIYIDSDVLFFPGAKELFTLIESKKEEPRYLLDCAYALDNRLLLDDSEKTNPANSGFILFKKALNWEGAVSRLEYLKGSYIFHTEQTIVHLALRQNQGIPLHPDKFIIRVDDRFAYKDEYANDSIVLRHYVRPVRHKFWFNIPLRKI